MSNELKPCPFCGGNAEVTYAMGEYWARCPRCRASGSMEQTEGLAIEAWSRRPTEDALQARIAELESENARLREALEKIKKMSYPDNVCNNCIHCQELVGWDWCGWTHKALEDASSQSCQMFTPHIIPQVYSIALKALKEGK